MPIMTPSSGVVDATWHVNDKSKNLECVCAAQAQRDHEQYMRDRYGAKATHCYACGGQYWRHDRDAHWQCARLAEVQRGMFTHDRTCPVGQAQRATEEAQRKANVAAWRAEYGNPEAQARREALARARKAAEDAADAQARTLGYFGAWHRTQAISEVVKLAQDGADIDPRERGYSDAQVRDALSTLPTWQAQALGAKLQARRFDRERRAGLRAPVEAPAPHGRAQSRPGAVSEVPPAQRVVDLRQHLDGTYVPPMPSVGGERDDTARLLYPGRWHSAIALTAAGKTWWALWHAVEEMRRGSLVAYCHFEETSPAGTIERLRAFGCPDEMITACFAWFDCSHRWTADDFGAALDTLRARPALVVLDGINAACSLHGWSPDKTEGVGEYRSTLVTPAASRGAAVLSLGHPPKARDRQAERHGFGSTAWLDEVDGAGFRLEASPKTPIRRGRSGTSSVYVVKDRYGEIERHGTLEGSRESGWYYLGSFVLDSSPERHNTTGRITVPKRDEQGNAPDVIDELCDVVLAWLVDNGGRFETQNGLATKLRAASVKFDTGNLAPALERMAYRGLIEWPETGARKPRPGWLVEPSPAPDCCSDDLDFVDP